MKLKLTAITLLALCACVLSAPNMNRSLRSSNSRALQEEASVVVDDPTVVIDGSVIPAPAPTSFKILGVGQLVQDLVQATGFSYAVFDTIILDSIEKDVSEAGVVYQANLQIKNDQGVSLNAVVSGNYDESIKQVVFNTTSYDVVIIGDSSEDNGDNATVVEPPVEGNGDNTIVVPGNSISLPEGYKALSQEDVANNQIASAALAYGVNALVQKGISQYKIPAASPEYSVTNFIGAASKDVSYGVSYLFYVNLTNSLNYKVDTNITVTYRVSNQTYKLGGYSFISRGYPINAIQRPNNTVVENPTTPPVAPVENPTTPPVVPVENPTTPPVAPVDNTTTPVVVPPQTTPAVTPDGFTVYSDAQFAQDATAKAALQFGIDTLIAKILADKKIPTANPKYNIQKLVLAAYKKISSGNSYKFQVNLINADYVHVDADLTVNYKESTKTNSLNAYGWKAYNISKNASNNNNNSKPVNVPTPASAAGNNASASTSAAPVNSGNTVVDNTVVPTDPVVVSPQPAVAADNGANADSGAVVVDNIDAVVAGN